MTLDPYDAVGLSVPVCAVVLEESRGSLPFHLIHGESLVATAQAAVGAAGIELLDQTAPWDLVVERGETLLLHDPLCPMTPPEFLAHCAERAEAEDVVVAGFRPVTDTVKQTNAAGAVIGTIDRERLLSVCSPVVLPPLVVADLLGDGGALPSVDFVSLLTALRERYGTARIDFVEAPPAACRVASEADLTVLAALTDPR
ncbi:MAG: 2-C-methyl-D-erythritol 4-phosphate cytidylyltransferase [Nocardioidaceae bacterium]|nr:2-C-methyl-D-erythritol 4-phosphate cytidylyltransferase [Nocardioidaceae bacterium]